MFYACQAKNEEVEELNKELRQCNLQQFIQQTGVVPSHTHSRSDLQEQLELTHYLQDGFQDGNLETEPRLLFPAERLTFPLKMFIFLPGQSAAPEEYPSRPTAKQFLGHPRNLQNPLVSSLNPEGVYV